MTNVLIVEDEAAAARHLKKLLAAHADPFTVVDVLTSVAGAVTWLRNHPQPDLFLFDIRLSDGQAFDIIEQCFIDRPIIFTTAYDEYALQAFRTSAIDYLLKPITAEDLAVALAKYHRISPHHDWSTHHLRNLSVLRPPPVRERFLLRKGKQLVPVRTDEIAYFYRDEAVFAVLFDGRRFLVDDSLQQLQQQLSPDHFFRLHRAYLTHVDAIREIQIGRPGRLVVSLAPGDLPAVELSPRRSRLLKERLEH